MNTTIKQPFSNVQLELLKIFAHQLPENDLLELKKLLADFFAQKLIQQADKVWEEKNWTNETVDNILNTKMRKSN